MNFWRKYHPDIGIDDPRYHQVSLIYSILFIMLFYFGLLTVLNVTLFDAADIAIYDAAGFVLALGVYFYVSRGGNFMVAGWVVTGTLIFVLLAFIHIAQGGNYSLLWVTILPPIAFFLLGPSAGFWVTGLVFAYCAWFLYQVLDLHISAHLTLGAFLNFVEVVTAQLFIFRYYERSRRAAYAQLQQTSVTDPLTGVFNRLHLDNTLQGMLSRARFSGEPLSVLLLDVDYFKSINDEYGHLSGDRVLVAIANVLKEAIRTTDVVGRWGGEEFLVICPNADAETALKVAERIRTKISAQPLIGDITVTASIGLTTSTTAVTPEDLLQAADKAMYAAKQAGRNTTSSG